MSFELTPEEALELYDWISHQYISYENHNLLDIVKRLRKYITEREESGDMPYSQ